MKILSSLSILTIILVSFSACTKTNNGPVAVNNHVEYVTASTTGSFAGTFYAYDSTITAVKNTTGLHPVTSITAGSSVGTLIGSSLSFVIWDYPVTTGTYQLDSVNATAEYLHFPDGGGVARRPGGTLVLTSVTPYITGTYTFTCTDLTIVTGSLNVVAP